MPKKNKLPPVPTTTVKARIALRRAITIYTQKGIDNSWVGSQPLEEHEEIERAWRDAPEKLRNAIDVFEAATRADAVLIALAAHGDVVEARAKLGQMCRQIVNARNREEEVSACANLARWLNNDLDQALQEDPKPREGNECRYCNGNMHYYSEIAAGPCRCAPEPGEIWQHTNGRLYVIVALSNTKNLRGDHPIEVVYRNHALDDNEPGAIWTRPLTDWTRSFVRMPPTVFATDAKADHE